MGNEMNIARSVSVIFSFIYCVGLVWFYDKTSSIVIFLAIVAICSSLFVSFVTKRFIFTKNGKMISVVVCVVGVLAVFSLILIDYFRYYGPDYGAIMIKFLFLTTFVVIGIGIYRLK